MFQESFDCYFENRSAYQFNNVWQERNGIMLQQDENILQLQMKSDAKDKKHLVYVDKQNSLILRKRFKQFMEEWDKDKQNFSKSPESQYYIVSTRYLEQFSEFCQSSEEHRPGPAPLNQDLLDAGGQLRPGLVEAQDFQIVCKNAYELIGSDGGCELPREAVVVGNQKRVPIYLDAVKYLKISTKEVRDIDTDRIEAHELRMKSVQISKQCTLEQLKTKIKSLEAISSRYSIRLWKNDKSETNESIYDYIKKKTAKIFSSYYRFDGLGKLIENEDAKIEDALEDSEDFFIAEVQEEYGDWFMRVQGEAKCQGCFKYKMLTVTCKCKEVSYCNEACMDKDKHYHMRNCKYLEEQELNLTIDMTISPSSALGRVGLSNLGNTCFMNSCLQCLSHTIPLTRYFLKKYYEMEVNKDNVLGSGGKLARNYAKFIKHMWCQKDLTYSPYNLKAAVAKLNPIFSGYAQHDSQQFFSYLVDGIHEDLNRVVKKPYVESVDSKGRSDAVVALQSWVAYTKRNQSIVVDLMTGQYKSKVICPTCNLQSITFDPFTTISLPIPEDATPTNFKYFVVFANHSKKTIKTNFQYTKADSKVLLQTATEMLKRNPEDFVLYVMTIYENIYGFEKTSKAQILHKIEVESKNVFLLQLTEQQKGIKQRVEMPTRYCSPSYSSREFENLWLKRPFFFERTTTTVHNMYVRILESLYYIWPSQKKIGLSFYVAQMLQERPFSLVLKSKKVVERGYHRMQTRFDDETKLDDLQVKLIDLIQNLNPTEFQLDVRFTRQTSKIFDFDFMKSFDDETTRERDFHKYSKDEVTVTIDQCFSIFEEQEKLDPGNQWYCPRCKEHKLATKEMTVYKAPEILILHLKRFKNKGIIRKQKNQTNVSFPMILDMKKYVIDPTPMSSYIEVLKKENNYLEPAFKTECSNSEPVYELYAISNHYGGLGGGHYTAYAKNNGSWFQFNDSSVRPASEDSITGSGAYMLFYKRVKGIEIN